MIKKSNIKISIIIPTYNCPFIKRSINSVVSQSFKDWELIITDDCSKNNVKKIVKKFNDKRIRYYRQNFNKIIGKSRNFGIKKSNYPWIAFLDSDDYWKKNKLTTIVKKIKSKKKDLYYHQMWLNYPNNQETLKKLYDGNLKIKKPIFDNLMLKGNVIPQSSVVVRKKIVVQSGYLSENKNLKRWEDFDLWLKISKKTNKFYYVAEPLGFYWVNNNSLKKLKNFIKIIKFFEIYYKKDINKILKKYRLKNLDWISQAKGVFLIKSKKYEQGFKNLNEIKTKKITTSLKIQLLKIFLKFNRLI